MIDGLSARNNQTSLPFMGASPMRLRHSSPEPTLGKLMCEPLITLTGPSATGRPGGSKALADAYVRGTQHYRSHHPHLHERVDGSWDKGRSRTRRDRGTGQLLCLHCDQAGEFLDLIEQFEHGD